MRYLGSSHIIAVADAEASSAFYREKLGFRRSSLELGPGWEVVEFGGCRICIGECGDNDDWISPASIPYHRWFAYIAVEEPESLLSAFKQRGVNVTSEQTEDDGERNFSIETPDGHQIMFGTGKSSEA